ncbi:MAG: hypothetical protein HDS77_08435, partial [Bacteroidales bacterium]|nr:hypothetical protein [Bacteroidales bacterium]
MISVGLRGRGGRKCRGSRREGGVDPDRLTITLLGAGGAAKAVALALSQAGAERVFVCNRTLSRAQELCAHDPLNR